MDGMNLGSGSERSDSNQAAAGNTTGNAGAVAGSFFSNPASSASTPSAASATTAATAAAAPTPASGSRRSTGRRADVNVDDILGQICSRMSSLTTDNKPEMVQAFLSVLMCTEAEANFFLGCANWDVATAVNVYLENKQMEEQEYAEELIAQAESRKRHRGGGEGSSGLGSMLGLGGGGASGMSGGSIFGMGGQRRAQHRTSGASGDSSLNAEHGTSDDEDDADGNIGADADADALSNGLFGGAAAARSGAMHPYKNVEVLISGIDRATWRAYVSPITGQIYFLHLATGYKQEMVPPGFADNPLPGVVDNGAMAGPGAAGSGAGAGAGAAEESLTSMTMPPAPPLTGSAGAGAGAGAGGGIANQPTEGSGAGNSGGNDGGMNDDDL